jgi:glycosyltransferase involved in cell wall biosynthesis
MMGINELLQFKSMFPHIKLIHRVNDKNIGRIPVDTRFDDLYKECSKHCEGTVFVSKWLEEYYQKKTWHCHGNTVIHNGVDRSIFKKSEDKLSKQNGKINIVTHHWSANEGKGFPIYEALDEFCEKHKDRFTFTYIGRHPGRFKYCNVIDPIFGNELGETLSRYDLAISASQYESGPNHVLEALACEIPVLLIDRSGGGLEFIDPKNYFSDWTSLEKLLLSGDYVKEIGYHPDTMEDCVENYVKFIRKLVQGQQ